MNPQARSRKPAAPGTAKTSVGKDELWDRHGLEDIYYQRESQINFFSIMGGVAAAVLLTQFFPLVEQVRLSRWHLILYFLASVFLLSHSWVMTSWGALVLRWRISYSLVLPHFLGLISVSIMCLLVTNPAGWSLAGAAMIFFHVLQDAIFWRSGSWVRFSPEHQNRLKTMLIVNCLMVLVASSASVQMMLHPSKTSETIWGAIALSFSIASIMLQQMGMSRERKELDIP